MFFVYPEENCPRTYVYAYDESSGTALWTCNSSLNADYQVTFCPYVPCSLILQLCPRIHVFLSRKTSFSNDSFHSPDGIRGPSNSATMNLPPHRTLFVSSNGLHRSAFCVLSSSATVVPDTTWTGTSLLLENLYCGDDRRMRMRANYNLARGMASHLVSALQVSRRYLPGVLPERGQVT